MHFTKTHVWPWGFESYCNVPETSLSYRAEESGRLFFNVSRGVADRDVKYRWPQEISHALSGGLSHSGLDILVK